MLSDKIKVLFQLKKRKQVEYARRLGRTPQTLNKSIKDDRLNVTDFIKLCDWLGVDIVLYDRGTNERITDLNINDVKKD